MKLTFKKEINREKLNQNFPLKKFKMNRIINFLSMIFILTFISCSQYSTLMNPAIKAKKADLNPNPIFDGEVEPAMPDSYENNKTVLGIDSNKNGIRDDVDIWINRTGLDYNERMAMRQYARAKQFWLKVCTENLINEVVIAENDVVNSGTCLNAISDYRRGEWWYIERKINYITLNTYLRKCDDFYFKNSSVVSIINGSKPHLNCTFQIENAENVINSYKKALEHLK